jgi:YggT family protein
MPAKLTQLLVQAIELYSYLLVIWVIGSWFPQLHGSKFYRWVDSVVYPYARMFRGIIPPLGGFDFSVIFAFLVLNLIQWIIGSLQVSSI